MTESLSNRENGASSTVSSWLLGFHSGQPEELAASHLGSQ